MDIKIVTQLERMMKTARASIVIGALVSVLCLAGLTNCLAATVALQWDAVTDSDLAGYKVYYQANSSSAPFKGSPVNVQNQTFANISNLDPNNAYYFAVTSYNTSGVESSYSNIVKIQEMVSPKTSITAPFSNASVSGIVAVSVNASDNVAVTKVEYCVNGVVQGSTSSPPYVFSWNSASLSSGNYTLMTKAYDAAGNVGQSSDVVVKVVNDTVAPLVELMSPLSGSTLHGSATITASAIDNVAVSKVEFYGNDILISATNVSPYRFDWDTTLVPNGTYALYAKAYDARGNVGQTVKTYISVLNVASADAQAPTVSITNPSAGSKTGGIVTVSAAAFDDVGVTRVAFYVDGVLKATDTASPFSYAWDTKAFTNGSHTVMAKASDAAGNSRSSSATVTVYNDTTAPTASIASPANSAMVSGTISVNVTASDNVGVSVVLFYLDGALKTFDNVAPYAFAWDTRTATNGSHILVAKAYDVVGNVRESSNVTVTVRN